MWAYLLVRLAGFWWLLPPGNLPTFRPSSGLVAGALLVAVPLSLSAAVALSKWLPTRRTALERSLP